MATAKLLRTQATPRQSQGFFVSGLTGIQAATPAYDLVVIDLATPGTPGFIQIYRARVSLSNAQPGVAVPVGAPLYVRWGIVRGDISSSFSPSGIGPGSTVAGFPPYGAIGPNNRMQGSTAETYDGAGPQAWLAATGIAGVLYESQLAAGVNVDADDNATWPDDPASPGALIVPASQGVQLIVCAPIVPGGSVGDVTNIVDVSIGIAIGSPAAASGGISQVPSGLPQSSLTVRN